MTSARVFTALQQGLVMVRDIVFPPTCSLCRQALNDTDLSTAPILDHSYICHTCWYGLKWVESGCNICHAPAITSCCQSCRKNPPYFDKVYPVLTFDGTVSQAIHRFKYEGDTVCLGYLGGLVRCHAQKHQILSDIDVCIPVPISRRRFRQRGYNQATLLAKHALKNTKIPLVTRYMGRKSDFSQQIHLSRSQRQNNVKNVFYLADNKSSDALFGKNVLLVDDVFTTGATVNACAKILKQAAKVKTVRVITLARVN